MSFADQLDNYVANAPAVHEEATVDLGRGVHLSVIEDWSNYKLRTTFSTPAGTIHAVSDQTDVYVRGPEHLLQQTLGSTVARKSRGGKRWVLISSSDEAWAQASFLSLDPTTQLDADLLVDKGPGPVIRGHHTRKLGATVNSNVFIGATRGDLTVYAAADPTPTPLAYTFTTSAGTVHATFNGWGRDVAISTPHGAIEDAAQ